MELTSPRRISARLAATAVATVVTMQNRSNALLLNSSSISSSSSSSTGYPTTSRYFSPQKTTVRQQQVLVSPPCCSSSEKNSPIREYEQQELESKKKTTRQKRKKSIKEEPTDTVTPRTQSFEPLFYGSKLVTFPSSNPSFDYESIPPPIHTLILGTHPSVTSLSRTQYFGHDQNAFWWIVGDCLQFRRNTGVSASSNKPFALCRHLRYDNIFSYEEQVFRLCSRGFALWDIVASCSRSGSLDSNIRKEIPNDIKGFCQLHPSIRRIVFANGGTGCSMFYKHNKSWWDMEDSTSNIVLVPGPNIESQKAFPKYVHRRETFCPEIPSPEQPRVIECISALSVSPAAAVYSYEAKRDHWEKFCFLPGLKEYRNWKDEFQA